MLQRARIPGLASGPDSAPASGSNDITRDGVLALAIPALAGASMVRQGLSPHIIHRLAVEGLLP